jgi:hypothetical protein
MLLSVPLTMVIMIALPGATKVEARETWMETDEEREFGHVLSCPFSDPECDANPAYSGAFSCSCPPPRMITLGAHR